MARPPKDPSDLKNTDIRIPVTADQKRMIVEALGGRELASWARDLILKGAKDLLGESKRKRTTKPS